MARRDGAPAGGNVRSLERAFEILELISANGGEMAVSEVSSRSGMPLPTIHRILRTMINTGYIRQLPSRRYALGPRLIALGETATRMVGTAARPTLAGLATVVGETANMAMLDGDRALCVAQVPSHHAVRLFTQVGRRVPLHCTGVGKALLSAMAPAAARALLERAGTPAMTARTRTDLDAVDAEIGRTRDRGWALDDGEQEDGVRCVGVVVPGAPTPAAISVSGPAARLTLAAVDRALPYLRETADALHAQFGPAV